MTAPQFRNILVTTDLSIASRASYGHAVAFARAFDAQVTVLNVDDAKETAASTAEAGLQTGATERRAQRLDTIRANFLQLGVPVTIEQDTGNAYRKILERVDSGRFDLLVMAKQGAGAKAIRTLGMTAERVMHHTSIPLLVGYAAIPQFDEVAQYKRLAVSTDYSEHSRVGIERVLSLADVLDAQVDIVHVAAHRQSAGRDPDAHEAWLKSFAAAQTEHLHQQHAQELRHPRASGRVLVGNRVPETLVEGVVEAKSDLLCIPTHGKGAVQRAFFGSTADRALRVSPVSSLILPGQWLKS